ncbi:hypothetical protein TRFO_31396 [Tritrichomonas foetus]|uniref:Uncharacterized protein n=1 Tax=Tritrichomonas foetus TaxID=1144522 RepID=A0A1J4JSG2_9EUKA|nr:hypothetical protein TRFO_31396 [Tritrichomonas foetus]|eukprot:OHT01698.1 hypothetical protein TRFO_31396 [Tritrichomonas foetus]
MTTLKDRVEDLLAQKFAGSVAFLQSAIAKFSHSLQSIKTSYRAVHFALVTAQSIDKPLKQSARTLANTLRDYIYSSLTFCTEYNEYIPKPTTEFQNLFLRSRITEFLSRQDSLSSDIKDIFESSTELCLKMAAKYQGVRPQSMKGNKRLLDQMTFPSFCDIEEDIEDLHTNLQSGKMLLDDLYMMYFKFIDNSSVFLTEKTDPVVELENLTTTMREELDECERLFVRKTSLFKKLYDRLDVDEKQEFARQLATEKPHEEEEEEEEESPDLLSRCVIG